MYLLYVDESGDVGLNNSPSRYFVLSGIVIHELRWHQTLDATINFRRHLKTRYGLKLREEIHSTKLIHNPGELAHIPKSLRLKILKEVAEFQASLTDINIINIVVDKKGKPNNYDVFNFAWTTLIQRFHNTISHKNFPGPQNADDNGMLIVDKTDEKKLMKLLRKMRRYNPVPTLGGKGYKEIILDTIISIHSYLIQIADVNAYLLKQKIEPCKYIKRKGGRNYFNKLDPILCKVASISDPQGIVCL